MRGEKEREEEEHEEGEHEEGEHEERSVRRGTRNVRSEEREERRVAGSPQYNRRENDCEEGTRGAL